LFMLWDLRDDLLKSLISMQYFYMINMCIYDSIIYWLVGIY
jgi:hypothetical protein